MNIIEGIRTHYRLLGVRGVYLVAKARLARKPLEVAIAMKGILHPVHLRLRTTDVSVFDSVLLHNEYAFDTSHQVQVIIDAGANIGLTSVYFANRYPMAKIFAIEPESHNFEMLKKNTARYPGIVPLQAALWKVDGVVNLTDPGSGSWGFQTEEGNDKEASGSKVRAITIDSLMREHNINNIDILKIDIEGSEKEVFESCQSWIDRVGVLIVELHDRWKSGCSRSVYAATKAFPSEWTRGETTFFVQQNYHQPGSTVIAHASSHTQRARIVAIHE